MSLNKPGELLSNEGQTKSSHQFSDLFLWAAPSCAASRGLADESRGRQVSSRLPVCWLPALGHTHCSSSRDTLIVTHFRQVRTSWTLSCPLLNVSSSSVSFTLRLRSTHFLLLSPPRLTDTVRYSAELHLYHISDPHTAWTHVFLSEETNLLMFSPTRLLCSVNLLWTLQFIL